MTGPHARFSASTAGRVRRVLALAAMLGATTFIAPGQAQEPDPAAAARRSVTTDYHGTAVTEEYRWLEDAADPAVRNWVTAQNARSRAWLDARPARAAVARRLGQVFSMSASGWRALVPRPGMVFALKYQPPRPQSLLVVLPPTLDPKRERVVLDPATLRADGRAAIDWFTPSPDGKLVAVCLSENGSEAGALHFYEAATGKRLPDRIERVQFPTGGGSAAWDARGLGIYYTRYPAPGERPAGEERFWQQVWYHRLGDPPEKDKRVLGEDFPRIAETTVEASPDWSKYVVTVANGDGGEWSHWIRLGGDGGPETGWKKLADFSDGIAKVQWGRDGLLYLLSRKGAPRGKILRLDPDSLRAAADPRALLAGAPAARPESEGVIQDFAAMATRLYLVEMLGGPTRLRVFDAYTGAPLGAVPAPEVSTLADLTPIEGEADAVFFRQVSPTTPSAWIRYDPEQPDERRLQPTPLKVPTLIPFDAYEAVREWAVSKDGTRVPMTILRPKKLALDGRNPLVLTGYGGYAIAQSPAFVLHRELWLAQGGVHVTANLRGGSEFGDAWHRAGQLTAKQNVFDDFLACARRLIELGYTSPEKLAIEGGSNGGLLMGAALTQAPELFRAVVGHVGIYDMLRVELDPNGAFNVTEFGSVRDPAQFHALYAYSPYHRVRDGEKYPGILLLTGDNDGRVNPMHSRKMTARLQAATASGPERPVLLRTSAGTGHGLGTALPDRLAELADVYAFLFDQLGMTWRELPPPPGAAAAPKAPATPAAKKR